MAKRPDWLFRQAAVVPFFGEQVVVVTSKKKKRWVLPKGVVNLGMSSAESARQEAFEEAGLVGTLRPDPIGSYVYQKWGGSCTVTLFVMDVVQLLDAWPEAHLRERELVSPEEAAARMREPELKQLLMRFK